jgi:hypothetical protein
MILEKVDKNQEKGLDSTSNYVTKQSNDDCTVLEIHWTIKHRTRTCMEDLQGQGFACL